MATFARHCYFEMALDWNKIATDWNNIFFEE